MRTKKDSSDLCTKSWQVIEKIIPVQRKSKWALKEIVNGIFYVCKNGCVWRDIPGDFPPWQSVYWYYRKWVKDDVWKEVSACLTVDYRIKKDKAAQASVGIIDSQSVKNSGSCTKDVGVDGGKKIKGRKRFIVVDTLGNILDSFVCPANCYDGTTALRRWKDTFSWNILLSNIGKVYCDGTFGGQFLRGMAETFGIKVEIPKVPIAQKGSMDIHEKRWIVERSFAWLNNNRRCAKDYERETENSNAFITIANIRRLAKNI